MTTEELHVLHRDVYERMLAAGWLDSFTFTDGKGWLPVWTAPGSQWLALLGAVIRSFELDDNDATTVMAFDIIAHGGRPPFVPWEDIPDAILQGWRKGVDGLQLSGSEHRLWVLVHIVSYWSRLNDVKFV